MKTLELDNAQAVMSPALPSVLSDAEIVRRVRAGDRPVFEILMRRHNQRVYRVARAVVKDEAEVEDVMQQAYVNAYTHLDQFEERAQFSTWLTRITLNEAFKRRRTRRRSAELSGTLAGPGEDAGEMMATIASTGPDPEQQAYAGELTRLIEHAIDSLPEPYRIVFVLRDVEGLSTSETGEGLGIGEEAVKTRLHRARAMMRRSLASRIGDGAPRAFPFHAPRCDRIVAAVLERIGES